MPHPTRTSGSKDALTASPEPPSWHQALAYAVTGHRYPELGRQQRPDVEQVANFLRSRLRSSAAHHTRPVPADLTAGLGAAQLWAAVVELRRLLELDQPARRTATGDGLLTAEDQRLLREVPPHHGG